MIQFALLFIYNSLVETNLYLTGPQPAEQHFYPSSLKFSLAAVGQREHCRATHLGLQRKVLAELARPDSLVQPSELYQFCLLSGELQSHYPAISPPVL